MVKYQQYFKVQPNVSKVPNKDMLLGLRGSRTLLGESGSRFQSRLSFPHLYGGVVPPQSLAGD